MILKRQKIDPIAAMAAANPASTAELAAEIGEVSIERELARAVALGRAPSKPIPAGDCFATEVGETHGGRSRAALGFGLGLTAAVALAALLVFGGRLGGFGESHPEFAGAAIRVAEANPRLLITAPGWKIVRADEFEPDSGELDFRDGSHDFAIHWYPAAQYGGYLRDRADVSTPEHGTLLGQRATTVEYSSEDYATMLSPQGRVFIEVRGRVGGRSAYDEVLRSLRPVDVKTWLSAMPPSTVRPAARAKAVEQMLRGIPLPPGFDAAALQGENSISDESSLAVKVGNAVACGWVGSWIVARDAGDQSAAERAVAAMAGYIDWPIVRENKVPWFSNYAIVAKQLRANRLDRGPTSYEVTADGRSFIYGPAWKMILGCGGTYRRQVASESRAQALALGQGGR
ncbi:MAG TPA: hypothetical protein VF176_00070 [Solirubrobacterales bacterium]